MGTAFVAGMVGGALYLQIRIIIDCGLIGLIDGAEWLWMFGSCR
jgi:hypothetical protein